jgi:hypothetical protein
MSRTKTFGTISTKEKSAFPINRRVYLLWGIQELANQLSSTGSEVSDSKVSQKIMIPVIKQHSMKLPKPNSLLNLSLQFLIQMKLM